MLLNIFYMLFKSNARETKAAIKELDKATKELDETFDEANEKANNLGRSFIKLVESGAAMAGAYGAYSFFKAGAIQATEYNKQLHVTSTLNNQHVGQLKALAQLSAQFGGSRENALQNLQEMSRFSTLRLGRNYDAMKHLLQLRQQYKMLEGNPQAQSNLLYGPAAPFQEPGLQMAIKASDAEFEKQINTSGFKGALSLTGAQSKKAFDAISTAEDLKGSVDQLNTTISDTLSGVIRELIQALSDLTHKLAGTVGGAAAAVAGGIGAAALAKGVKWGAGARLLLGGGAVTGAGIKSAAAMTAAGGGAATVLTGLGATAVGGAAGYGIVSLFSDRIEGLMVKYLNRDLKELPPRRTLASSSLPPSIPESKGGTEDDMTFWMKKGYSKDQAAGIIANMMRESNGDINARGDGGRAHGLFQWHPHRRAAILKATGIDVSKANRQQQLEAAAWEMKHGDIGFSDDYFRQLKGANLAASYFSTNFERPADKIGEAVRRGKLAMQIASKTQVAPNSVSIGEININVPNGNAEDIAKHIKSAIVNTCSDVQSKADNGRMG